MPAVKELPKARKVKKILRCWPMAEDDFRMIRYHDTEWGNPVHDDALHFEYLVLDAFQAGLSWRTILNKRENFRKAFSNFDPKRIVRYDSKKIGRLMQDAGIIRNRLKILGTVKNARAFLEIQKEFGSFDAYIWQFTGHKILHNCRPRNKPLPSKSPESDAMSLALKKRGFTFVGSTICYAYMQAAGMVNDHLTVCPLYKEILKK